MKATKKLGSMLLAVLMLVMCLSVTAFAAGETTGSITLDNPMADKTYTACKIFDVSYTPDTDPTAFSYTISSTSPWYNTVNTYAQTGGSGLTLTQSASDENVYVVSVGEGFSAPAFAAALQTALTDGSVTDPGTQLTTSGDGDVTASGLDLGYYLVTTGSGALCNLTTTTPNVTIHDKNDVPFEKTVSDSSVEVGQTVTYTITGKVPDTTGFASYTYKITDTMSEGLTFNADSVKVYIGDYTEGGSNTELGAQYYELNTTSPANDFTLDFKVMNMSSMVGETITVVYTATVNENAVAEVSWNDAKLDYSNDPQNPTDTETITNKVPVYSAEIIIDKYAAVEGAPDNRDTKLEGAEFVLYKEVAAEGGEGEPTIQYYKYDEDSDTVSWVNSQEEATVFTTDNQGAATIKGLEDGTYYLLETRAPEGYNLLDEAVEIKIDGTQAPNEDGVDNTAVLSVTSSVANNTGTRLPETGGMGTTLFYIVGGILVVAAGVLLITRRRMNANER